MARAVGLDLGSRTLKLVELTGSAKGFKVARLLVRPVPTGTGEEAQQARVELVRQVFAEAKVSKDDVCASFDAGSTVFREISVPFHDEDQIEKVVRFEAESHLHGRAIEDVVVNWVKLSDTKDGSQVLVLAAPKDELAGDLATLRAAGVEPASVDLDATALYTACDAAGVFRDDPSVAVVEVGARTTSLLVVDGGRLRGLRSFLVGSETVATALQGDLSLPEGEASARAIAPGGPDAGALLVPAVELSTATKETAKTPAQLERDQAAARREELFRKLERELRRSLAAVRTPTPPTKILLAGGGACMPGLEEALAERMGLPVEPVNLLSRLGGWRPSGPDARFEEAVAPVAVGCALRLLGVDPLGIELRREEYAPSNTFDVVKGALALALTLLVALLGLLTFTAREQAEKEKELFLTSRNGVSTRAATIFQKVEERYQAEIKNKSETEAQRAATAVRASFPNDESFLLAVRGKLLQRYNELERDLGLSRDVPPIESALKVWKEFVAALATVNRDDLGWFALTSMNVTQTNMTVKIEIGDVEKVDVLLAALSKSEYFRRRAKNPQNVWQRGGMNVNAATKRYTGSLECPFAE